MVWAATTLFSPVTTHAANFFPNDATIDSLVAGDAVIGFDRAKRFGQPDPIHSSPTVNILGSALVAGNGSENGSVNAFNQSTVNMDKSRRFRVPVRGPDGHIRRRS